MKILVTREEVEQIVLEHLKKKGWPIGFAKVETQTKVEGQYEDQIEVFEGITVEVV